uniref:Glycine N-acyltransferase-like protein n=1 Tax=Panagrellus redivivus TaxID=6233 RepID=A0A7E4UQU1_PANRE
MTDCTSYAKVGSNGAENAGGGEDRKTTTPGGAGSMSLRRIRSPVELDEALAATSDNAAFLGAHYGLLIQKQNRFPEATWLNWAYKSKSGDPLFCLLRSYSFQPRVTPIMYFFCEPTVFFEREAAWPIFDAIAAEAPLFFQHDGSVVVGVPPITNEYEAWFIERYPSKCLEHFPCHYYYMSPAQRTSLIDDSKAGIPIPDEYFFDKANLEHDADLIASTWRHSGHGELDYTKAKIRAMPSSLIRHKLTQLPAAFEMTDAGGFLTHHYTMPEHRRKGLGEAVEKDICRKLINEGFVPSKDVETFNEAVLSASNKSPYWTRWEVADEPVVMTFLKHVAKESEIVLPADTGSGNNTNASAEHSGGASAEAETSPTSPPTSPNGDK